MTFIHVSKKSCTWTLQAIRNWACPWLNLIRVAIVVSSDYLPFSLLARTSHSHAGILCCSCWCEVIPHTYGRAIHLGGCPAVVASCKDKNLFRMPRCFLVSVNTSQQDRQCGRVISFLHWPTFCFLDYELEESNSFHWQLHTVSDREEFDKFIQRAYWTFDDWHFHACMYMSDSMAWTCMSRGRQYVFEVTHSSIIPTRFLSTTRVYRVIAIIRSTVHWTFWHLLFSMCSGNKTARFSSAS